MKTFAKTEYMRAITLFLWSVILAPSVFAFSGGSGTPTDPYQIRTVQDLLSIGSNPALLQSHYLLVNDIDLDPNRPGGQVFDNALIAPSASRKEYQLTWSDGRLMHSAYDGTPFSGTFKGNLHTLHHMTIDGQGGLGLFGKIDPDGVVCDLNLRDVKIRGASFRTLAGMMACENDGTLINCHVEGVLETALGAGLVNINRGIIQRSHSVGTMDTAGLVADNEGLIESSYGVLENAQMRVRAGGLVANNTGHITDCYARGRLTSTNIHASVGGLVSLNAGIIDNCYADVEMTVDPNAMRVGPLVGWGLSESDISILLRNSYYLAETDPDSNDVGIPLSESAMRDVNSFPDWDFAGNLDDGDREIWFMPENGYPVLSWQTAQTGWAVPPSVRHLPVGKARQLLESDGWTIAEVSYDYDPQVTPCNTLTVTPSHPIPIRTPLVLIASQGPYDWNSNPGTGEFNNPFLIDTPGQLDSLGRHPELWDLNFCLTQDLDMSRFTYRQAPIAWDQDDTNMDFQGRLFTGQFDGRDHTIHGLTLWAGDVKTFVGLFGKLSSRAEILNVCIEDSVVRTGELCLYVGVLAGWNGGIIRNCNSQRCQFYVGQDSGEIGGLLGRNSGQMESCSWRGTQLIEHSTRIGALVGNNTGLVDQCTAKSDTYLTNPEAVGLLVGDNTGSILQSKAAGMLTTLGGRDIGGLVGLMKTSSMGIALLTYRSSQFDITRTFTFTPNHKALMMECVSSIQLHTIQPHSSSNTLNVGGCAGFGGNLSNCYSQGIMQLDGSAGNAGGLVGTLSTSIENCYSSVQWDNENLNLNCLPHRPGCAGPRGALVGHLDVYSSDIKNSYYLVYDPCDPLNNGWGTPLTHEQMQQQESYQDWDFVGGTADGSDDIWAMPAEGYPYLYHVE